MNVAALCIELRIMESQLNQSMMRRMNEKLLEKEQRIIHIFKKRNKRYTLVHQSRRKKSKISCLSI